MGTRLSYFDAPLRRVITVAPRDLSAHIAHPISVAAADWSSVPFSWGEDERTSAKKVRREMFSPVTDMNVW